MFSRGNVTILMADFERSIRFNVNQLGLKLKSRYANERAEVEAPGVTIGIHHRRSGAHGATTEGSISIGPGEKNLDVVRATLEQKRIGMGPNVGDGPVRLAHFEDPDGTRLYPSETDNGKAEAPE